MAEIQVYAPFPRTLGLDAQHSLDPSNWRWVHCLTLPIEKLGTLQFSSKPYKWIRYGIGVVVGAQGDLSYSRDSPLPTLVDYDTGILPAESIVLYYHTNDEERRRMFPTDPKIGHTSVTSSVATSRRSQFRTEVEKRDGGRCTLSGIDHEGCDAAHLLPHSKGNSYIFTYTQRRSRDPSASDVVADIDSVRNGLFLNKLTHCGLRRHIAFLRTPNFALDTSDVDPVAPPAELRYTAHLFTPATPHYMGWPGSTSLRVSNEGEWPPAILFDAVYAGAVLHHFGAQELNEEISTTWNDAFYPAGVPTPDEKAATSQRARDRAEEHAARSGARRAPDTFDTLMAMPYILVPPSEVEAAMREARENAEAIEQKRVQEKVTSWMENITHT
ncbi:hypothetical protein MD484_g2508, partial [Candolleomyces efflorescens]